MSIFSKLVLLSGVILIAIGAFFTFLYSTVTINCLCPTSSSSCCEGYFAAQANQKIISASIMGYGVMLLVLVWYMRKQVQSPLVK
jgi:hypothetical protein